MALTAEQRSKIREKFYRVRDPGVDYTKTELNAVVDAMDQWLSDNQAAAAAAMEAVAPGVFDTTAKKRIAAGVFWNRYVEDLV